MFFLLSQDIYIFFFFFWGGGGWGWGMDIGEGVIFSKEPFRIARKNPDQAGFFIRPYLDPDGSIFKGLYQQR